MTRIDRLTPDRHSTYSLSSSIGHLMIAVLRGLADVERDLIRTAERRSRAKARKRRAEGATLKELAQSYNVGRATISRLAGQAVAIVHRGKMSA